MPLTLNYETFRDPAFQQSVLKIANCQIKDQKAKYNVMRILKKLEDEQLLAQKQFSDLAKGYALLDEHGEFVPERGQPGTFSIRKDVQAEWKEKLVDFNMLTFEIQWHPIKPADVEDAKLTAADMMMLEPLLDLAGLE